jgi:hypothetical protein
MPSADQLGEIRNRLINEEMSYDRDSQREHERIYNNLNGDKKIALWIQTKENTYSLKATEVQLRLIYGRQ